MKESLKIIIQSTLVERAPHGLTVDNFIQLIQGEEENSIINSLDQLIEEGIVSKREGNIKDDYHLTSYENIPTKRYININGIKVPRMLSNDTARPEDINLFFESLANKTADIENTIEERLDDKLKSYWANIIVLFGAFIGLFSLIITFVQKVEIKGGETFWNVLSLNTAQVFPLAIVLAGFVYLLKKLFK